MFCIKAICLFVLLATVGVSPTISSGQTSRTEEDMRREGPIQKGTAQIVAQVEAKRKALDTATSASSSNRLPELAPSSKTEKDMISNRFVPPPQVPATNATPASENKILGFTEHDFVWFVGGALLAILFFMLFFQRRPRNRK